jgi:hypothetical protein
VYQVSRLRKETNQSQTKGKPKPLRYEVEAETGAGVTATLAAKVKVILAAKVIIILRPKLLSQACLVLQCFTYQSERKSPTPYTKEKVALLTDEGTAGAMSPILAFQYASSTYN